MARFVVFPAALLSLASLGARQRQGRRLAVPAARARLAAVAFDGTVTGLSADGRTLVLATPRNFPRKRHYGIGPLTSITILAELGEARRFSSSREASATPAWTSPSPTQSHPGSRTEIRLGVRAHPTPTTSHAHAPPRPAP